MAYSNYWKIDKIDKLFICLLLIFICIFEFCNTFVFADDDLSFTRVPNLVINTNYNYFTYSENGSVGYIQMEKGYIYHISFDSSGAGDRTVAVSSSVPELYSTYSYLTFLKPGDTFSYACTSDEYLYLDYSWYNVLVTVSSERIPGINSAIDDLVNNVGIDNIWSIFDISVNYIVVVVLFAIGVYIIFSFIKKGSKGKSGF